MRLLRGRFDQETVYGDDPAYMAERFREAGAQWIHVVDLDGARDGEGKNLACISRITRLGVRMELGGGIRTLDDVKRRMDLGVTRCILGTAAIENPALVERACSLYPGRIAVGIDEADGFVAVRGWEQASQRTALDLAGQMAGLGVQTVIHTDITRDGTQMGPNIAASAALSRETGLDVIVSGGVGGPEDVQAVRDAALAGVIIGKAIYEGKIDVAHALRLGGQENGHSL